MIVHCFVSQGQMQLSYEHCLPQKNQGEDAKRSVVVFRHGASVTVSHDTGVPAGLFANPNEQTYSDINKKSHTLLSAIHFGHPRNHTIFEGKKLFSLVDLVKLGGHR